MNYCFVLSKGTILLLCNIYIYTRFWCFCVLSQTLPKTCNLFVTWSSCCYFNVVILAVILVSFCSHSILGVDVSCVICRRTCPFEYRVETEILEPSEKLYSLNLCCCRGYLILSPTRRSNDSSACWPKWLLETRLNGIILNRETQFIFIMKWGKCCPVCINHSSLAEASNGKSFRNFFLA